MERPERGERISLRQSANTSMVSRRFWSQLLQIWSQPQGFRSIFDGLRRRAKMAFGRPDLKKGYESSCPFRAIRR
jgi:hypothetical protein